MKKDKKKKGSSIVKEFRDFIQRGNVMDLAVGVIVGAAFGKIVSSLVDDILMPVIGSIIGGIDFSGLSVTIGKATIKYGNFINNVIDFLIVALCIFFIVKAINKIMPKKEEKKPEPKKSDETLLLEEIRDLLKKKTK